MLAVHKLYSGHAIFCPGRNMADPQPCAASVIAELRSKSGDILAVT